MKTLSNYYLQFFFTSFIYYLCAITCQAQSSQSFSSIYSSTSSAKINTKDNINQIVFMVVAKKAGWVFATAQDNGLIVLDSNNNNALLYYQKQKGALDQAIDVTSDGAYVFLSMNNQFNAFQFTQSGGTYTLKQFFSKQTDTSQIQRIQILFNENRLIIAHLSGVLTLVDISQRSSQTISVLANYQVSSTLRALKVTQDMLWVVLGDYTYGIMLFYWQDPTKAQTTLNLVNVGISSAVSPSYFVLTADGRYIIMIEYWSGLTIIDLNDQLTKYSQNNYTNFSVDTLSVVVAEWWVDSISSPDSVAIALTADENFVMIGERSVGIYIINVSTKTKPILFQKVSASFDSLCVVLSLDTNQSYLYYSNGQSLLAFKKSVPNLNTDVPNIYNVQRSTTNNAGSSQWRWIAKVEANSQFLFQSDYDQGLIIMDLRQSAQIMTQVQQIQVEISGGSVDNFLFFGKNDQYLAVPIQRATTIMDIYDIADRTNPQLIQSLPSSNPSYSYSMDMSTDQSLLIIDNNLSLLIFNSSTIGSFTLITQWTFTSGVFSSILNGLVISPDKKHVIMVERQSVIAILDISNPANPLMAKTISTKGGEIVVKGLYGTYTNYVFIAQGLYGIDVVDMTQFPNYVVISNIQTQGYSNNIALFQNSTYAVVSTSDIGQIQLVNYTDVTSPKIISSFQYMNEHGTSACVTPSEDYFFILNQNGLRTVPLKSSVYIHTEIQNILNANTGSPTIISLNKSQPLFIGQQINFQFQVLLPISGMQITNIFYIQYYQQQSLPYWMTYNSNTQTLSLQIVKDSLGQNYNTNLQGQQVLNTIVVQSNLPVEATDFVFTLAANGVVQDLTQATLIWNYFHDIGLLDKSDFVTSVFQYQKPLGLNLQGVTTTTQLLAQIQLVLQNSILYNPVYFNTQSSLTLNVNPSKLETTTNNDGETELLYVSALQSRIYLYLSINTKYGVFVDRSYNGLISSTTQARDQLQLEGDATALNNCLNRQIEVYIYDSYNSNSSLTANEVMQMANITVQLQDNVNYDIVNTYTLTNVTFFHYRDKIVNNTALTLQNQVYSQFSNAEVEIKTVISIEFSQKSFVILDNQTDQTLPITYSAYLIEDDQYVEIPSSFWLQFSPSLLKFSGQGSYSEYNNRYCFFINATDTYSVASDSFCILANQIPFIIIFNLLCQILGPIIFILGLYRYQNIIYNFFYAKENIYSTEYAKINHMFYHRTLFIGENVLMAHEILTKFISEFNAGRIVQTETPDAGEEQNNDNNEVTQIPEKITDRIKEQNSQDVNLSKDRQKKVIQMSKITASKQTKLEKVYVNPKTKALLFTRFMNDLIMNDISYRFQGEIYTISHVKDLLQMPQNLLRLSLRSLLARYLVQRDRITYKAYNFMKEYALEESRNYTKNDWYKHFVSINHQEDEEENEDALYSALAQSRYGGQQGNQNYNQFANTNPNNITSNHNLTNKNNGATCSPHNRIQTNINANGLNAQRPNNLVTQFKNERRQQKIPSIKVKKDVFDQFLNTIYLNDEMYETEMNQIDFQNRSRAMSTSIKKMETLKAKLNLSVNRNLLKEMVIGDALGLVYPPPSRLHPCSGESIHLLEHEISSVRAFTRMSTKSYFTGLRRLLKMEYVPLASYENRKLPQWLDYSSRSDLFLIKGCPTIEDQEEILLRFYNQKGFIIKQFLIKIEIPMHDEKMPSRVFQFQRAATIQQTPLVMSSMPRKVESMQESLNLSTPRKSFQFSNNNILKNRSHFVMNPCGNNLNSNGEDEKDNIQVPPNLDEQESDSTHINLDDMIEMPSRTSKVHSAQMIKSDEVLSAKALKLGNQTNPFIPYEKKQNFFNKYEFDVDNLKAKRKK